MESEILIEQIISGDQAAFNNLYHAYYGAFYKYTIKYSKHRQDAEDLVQEAFTRIYVNLHKYNYTCKLSTWMFCILRNLCIDRFRRKRNTVSLDQGREVGGNSFLEELIDYECLPDHKVEMQDTVNRVNYIVNSLPPKYRRVIMLRYYSDCSLQDIAVKLEMQINTVKIRILRGKDQIRKRYLAEAS